jgi:hypothetical protein
LAVVHQPYIPAPIKIGTQKLSAPVPVMAMPNPTQSQVTLKTAAPVKWTFYDATGRPVHLIPNQDNQQTEATFNVSHLATGLYFGQGVSVNGQRHRTQFVKIH